MPRDPMEVDSYDPMESSAAKNKQKREYLRAIYESDQPVLIPPYFVPRATHVDDQVPSKNSEGLEWLDFDEKQLQEAPKAAPKKAKKANTLLREP